MDISKSTVTITSFNSYAINDGTNYRASFPAGIPLMAETEPQYAGRLDDFPIDTKTVLKERVLPVQIWTVAGTLDTLKTYLNSGKMTKKKLIVTDSTNSSAWYVYAKFKSIVKRKGSTNVYDVVFSVADSIWRKNTNSTSSWSVTTSGQTQAITVGGTEYARPIITLTPKTANTSTYAYKRFVAVTNETDSDLSNYPLNITGGNFNHQSLVSGGKAQADGDDWRCAVDGKEVDMWTGGGGFNSTTFRPWINIDLEKKIEVKLLGAIASSGAVSTISVVITEDSIVDMLLLRQKMDSYNLIQIGSELFSYTGITAIKSSLQFTGCTRAARGSSMAAHSTLDVIKRVEHEIWIYYGLSSATARDLTTRAALSREPMLDKTNSTNTSWVWTDYYSQDYPNRSGSWRKYIVRSKNQTTSTPSQPYGANHATNTDFTSIASEMGISLKSYYKLTWLDETGEIDWRIYNPCLFTTISVSGEKYRVGTKWATAGLRVSNTSTAWQTIWEDATPASTSTWTALAAHSSVATGSYSTYSLFMSGTTAKEANALNHIEFDSITAVITSGRVPAVNLVAEQANYYVNIQIKNDTTGKYINLLLPGALNSAITVDCDAKTVTDGEGTNVLNALSYGPEKVRQDWLTLEVGSNTISVTETGVVRVDFVFTYQERSL